MDDPTEDKAIEHPEIPEQPDAEGYARIRDSIDNAISFLSWVPEAFHKKRAGEAVSALRDAKEELGLYDHPVSHIGGIDVLPAPRELEELPDVEVLEGPFTDRVPFEDVPNKCLFYLQGRVMEKRGQKARDLADDFSELSYMELENPVGITCETGDLIFHLRRHAREPARRKKEMTETRKFHELVFGTWFLLGRSLCRKTSGTHAERYADAPHENDEVKVNSQKEVEVTSSDANMVDWFNRRRKDGYRRAKAFYQEREQGPVYSSSDQPQ